MLNTKKLKLRELKKENEKLREESKSKVKEEDERDDTTYSSTEDEGDEEESDHQRSTPEKKMKVAHKLSCKCLLLSIWINFIAKFP